MNRYQYRRRIEGDAWQNCTESKAMEILGVGYSDPTIAIPYLEEGRTIVTSVHEVRLHLDAFIPQRNEPQPDETGEILFA